jgi:hypothetical protein
MQTLTAPTFADRLRHALLDDPLATFVLLGNFEVEERWARAYGRLPGAAVKSSAAVVNRMDELALGLATARDVVLLKDRVDPAFERHREQLGFEPARVLTCDHNHPERSLSEDALESPRLLAELTRLARDGAYLLPLGTSALEERLSTMTGLPLAVPSSAVFQRVNSKIYSRRLTDRLGLRATPGQEIASVEELGALDASLLDELDDGGRIVVKEALGVSGKGIVVIDRRRRFEQLVAMLQRRAARTGDDRLDLVVELWIDKACDLNYQFVIGRDGTVTFDFVKEALTEGGVHKGHLMPSRLDHEQVDELRACASAIGASLFEDGYRGVVGVDAILDTSGRLYPVLEINARFNMSTYQTDIAERMIGPGKIALARHFNVRLRRPLGFDELATSLGKSLYDRERASGFVVNDFAAVNAAATPDRAFDGRLYGLLIANSYAEIERLDAAVASGLQRSSDR